MTTDEEPTEHVINDHVINGGVIKDHPQARLFEEEDAERFRTQWREVQAGFVDEPRTAVREAETLMSKMMDELKSHLNDDLRDDDNADTEQLRITLRRYRSLADQILSI
jgi:hypothetical protein